MDEQIKARLKWVKLYAEKRDAGFICRYCGISRPTLRKWYKSYCSLGPEGLKDKSRKPHCSPNKKVDTQIEKWILDLRVQRNLGSRRIQTELSRLHNCKLSVATIHKVLSALKVDPIKKLRRKKEYKRYSCSIPGNRIQIDTCKIAPGIYQYTAVDDCTRWRVLEIYKRRTANNTLNFIEKMIEEFPFPIQRIQSDRGLEFFAEKVQQKFMEYGIKFRPVKPASPHLNGKVERSQRTDLEEFYPTADLNNFGALREELGCWQFYYNWQRPHGSLKGKTPSQVESALSDKTPLQEEVWNMYDPSSEHIQIANYYLEMQLRKLKGCL
jgi:transposase InsO family protein